MWKVMIEAGRGPVEEIVDADEMQTPGRVPHEFRFLKGGELVAIYSAAFVRSVVRA